ncbi:MAG: hypothetical protein J7452_00810 [Thermoflexus sp.]|nr:hypothetical protein [Thermoflexus sp.]
MDEAGWRKGELREAGEPAGPPVGEHRLLPFRRHRDDDGRGEGVGAALEEIDACAAGPQLSEHPFSQGVLPHGADQAGGEPQLRRHRRRVGR